MSEVLALKYRPKNFSELIGQESVSKSLSYALDSGRIGHAYLFSGLRGSGKTSSARILAKALLCEKGVSSKPCEVCDSCKMANAGTHFDIIEMDAASRRKIDDIRELIERTHSAPALGKFKVFIIDEVHMLTKEAANAFLKTLEEPLEHVKFILATTDPLKLPATILSRTQHFRFKAISPNLVVSHLKNILNLEGINFEDEALNLIARSGSGSLRDSITLLDQAINFTGGEVRADRVADMLGLLDPARIDEILSIVVNQDRDALIDILKELEAYDAQTIIEQLITNLRDKFLAKNPKFSTLMYERFFRILSEAKSMLGSDDSFTLAMTLFMMMEALNLKEIDAEILEIQKASVKTHEISPKPQSIKNSLNSPDQRDFEQTLKPEKPAPNEDYERYIRALYDRNYDLGECFKEAIEFVKFENNTLFVISHAKGKNREILRKSSRAIMAVLRATFGDDANINISQPKDDATKNLEKTEPKQNFDISSDLKNLKDIKNSLVKDDKSDIKAKNSEILNELKSTNTYTINEDEKKLKELNRLFGEPKIES
ncbi:DNA polymerase III subunit gamma/tau [Campylobacter corcagiensis]|uniref:DNA polymerase III subunit gamma/tau n=1 Tax=Campylobacter corcagiensis TaxID=1448857 RepID=A0A7M1LH67_9BACT|nr:DNA polymerase III subunit gamma/tau [Campylobacter corcagiensis]QKF64133.1 DNA polymerase III, gamma and tau subunits [Campylobacter corcagiensis]QOQ87671.1 DNA polymerase III subunit gamma/tau [Campylobacter corcagiensis]